jgi:hypothetical protein
MRRRFVEGAEPVDWGRAIHVWRRAPLREGITDDHLWLTDADGFGVLIPYFARVEYMDPDVCLLGGGGLLCSSEDPTASSRLCIASSSFL